MSAPVLETERLILRQPQSEDFEPWVQFHADEEVMRFLGGVQGPELTWRAVCTMTGSWTIEGFSMFSIIEKQTGDWIGRLGPWRPNGWPGTEIGWGLAPSAWGKGYATEAVLRSRRHAYEELGATTLVSYIHPDNEPSKRVAERVGAVPEETIDLCGFGPHVVYRHPGPAWD